MDVQVVHHAPLHQTELSAFVIILVLFLALIYALLPSAQDRAVAALPRPSSTLPVVGNTLDAMFTQRMRLHDWFTENCRQFGGVPWVFKVVGQPPMVVIYTEATVEDVLKTQFDVFPRGAAFRDALQDLFGDGILNADGVNWFHQRTTASRLFTPHMMRDVMEPTIRHHTARLVTVVRDAALKGDAFDVKHLLELYATDVFTKIGFGVDLHFLEHGNTEFFDRFRRIGNIVLHRNEQPTWLWKALKAVGVGPERQQSEDIAWVDQFILRIISDAIAAKPTEAKEKRSTDLVDLFINSDSTDSDSGRKLPEPRVIRDMAMSFISGGRETTAYGMSWFLIHMAKYPHVQERIRAEIAAKLPGLMAAGDVAVPTKEQTNELPYLEAAIKETLRLYPVVPINVRTSTEDVTLVDGTFLSAGTKVLMPNYAMARMTAVWGPDAAEFKPERWLDAETGKVRVFSPFKFTTFSGGPRMCFGRTFSLMEMKIALSALLARFTFTTEKDPRGFAYDKSLVLSILGPVMVRATPIGGVAVAASGSEGRTNDWIELGGVQ